LQITPTLEGQVDFHSHEVSKLNCKYGSFPLALNSQSKNSTRAQLTNATTHRKV
jgi:hypothetical protein